jgi:hypothetical protein
MGRMHRLMQRPGLPLFEKMEGVYPNVSHPIQPSMTPYIPCHLFLARGLLVTASEDRTKA